MTNPVQPDQLRISIEMGDDYEPSPRLRAALDELAATLVDEESDAEVSGYDLLGNFEIQDFKVLSYDTMAPTGQRGTYYMKAEMKAEGFDGKGNDVVKF